MNNIDMKFIASQLKDNVERVVQYLYPNGKKGLIGLVVMFMTPLQVAMVALKLLCQVSIGACVKILIVMILDSIY